MRTTDSKLTELAQKVAGAFPELDRTAQDIAVVTYRLLAEGKPVSPEAVARQLSLEPERVRETWDSWPGVYYDDNRKVIGFWGLALQEMPHRFTVDGRQLYTWCSWDSLFIPEILGKTAEVESTCPVTGETISLTVGPDGVESVAPAGARVSFLVPTASFDTDVVMSFCHFVLFFSSEKAGKKWSGEHENTFLLTVEEAHQIGRLTNRINLGDALRR